MLPSIRPAEPRDFDAIAALTNHYILHTAVHFATTPQTADELRGSWVASGAKYPFLVAEIDGRFAGFAKSYRWRERDAYARTAEVGIYVESGVHRRGVARSLYAALFDACRVAGFHTLIGGIALPNDASVRLHESLGFRPVGVFRQVGRKFDAWHDVAFYQLML